MTIKRFLLPWERETIIKCDKCGGRMRARSLWPGEAQGDENQVIRRLQPRFCHPLNSDMLNRIPVLSLNDASAFQKWKAFKDEQDARPPEEKHVLYSVWNGTVLGFSKHGVFLLTRALTEMEFKTLLVFLCLAKGQSISTDTLSDILDVSKAYISISLFALQNCLLVESISGLGKGKAKGRRLFYRIVPSAQTILERDLREYSFFRNAVIETANRLRDRISDVEFRHSF